MKRLLAAVVLVGAIGPTAGAQDLTAELMAIEHRHWAAWGRKDGSIARAYLTEDAVDIVAGTPPISGRDAIVKAIETLPCEMASFRHEAATLRRVTPDVVILSYAATQDTTCEGRKLPARLQSVAVYVRKGGKWLQTSYQETALE
jgi:uncharacterized protein (TIGR02246 family)